jgi:hypothetical protein
MGFEINPIELASSYGGKTEPPKTAGKAARVISADQKSKDQESVTTMQQELAKRLAQIDSDTAEAASTSDPRYRAKLLAGVESARNDIPGIKREITRLGGAAASAPAEAASAPAEAASAEAASAEAASASGAGQGFAIDPAALSTSFVGKGGAEEKPGQSFSDSQKAAGAGLVAGALYGARQNAKNAKQPEPIANDSLAARLMEKRMGLPAGAISAYEHRLYGLTNPQDIALDVAREINSAKPPAAPVATGALPVAPTGAAAGPRAEPTMGAAQTEPTADQVARILQGGNGATLDTTGRARQAGYNIQTAQEAAIMKTLIANGMSEESARAYLAQMPGLTATDSGVLIPRSTAVPTAGARPQAPSVWTRPRAIGPVPWANEGQSSALGAMGEVRPNEGQPSALGSMGEVRPGAAPAAPAQAAPAPAAPAQQIPSADQMASRIRAASARAHMLQRGANVGVRGAFGAPLAAQAYGMATQEEPTDWQQWLSLFGGGLGTFGPLTSKLPFMGRVPVAGPVGALAQVPYAIKHREEIARGMTLPDVVGNPNVLTGPEMFEKLPLFHIGDR